MAVPADANDVLKVIRLGWSMSEVRGRNRPGWTPDMTGAPAALSAAAVPAALPAAAPAAVPAAETGPGTVAKPSPPGTRPDWGACPLPLENELTLPEMRIETQAVLGKLATDLHVNNPDDGRPGSYSERVDKQAEVLAYAGPGDIAREWDELARLILDFDLHIQDKFTLESKTMACGYQLGRALADSYWALDPALTKDPENQASWSYLLGAKRCSETERLLGRLSAYFHTYTAAAIAGSVQVWKGAVAGAAAESSWHQHAYPALYQQIRHWYELVLLEQDPTTLIQPYQLLKDWRLVWRTVRLFWVQLVLALLAAAAFAVFAYLLTMPSVSAAATTLLGTAGIAGFSVAGLAAKVKNDAQAMLKRVEQDAYTDLIAEAITTAPPPPKAGAFVKSRQKAEVARIMRGRRLTPVTSNE